MLCAASAAAPYKGQAARKFAQSFTPVIKFSLLCNQKYPQRGYGKSGSGQDLTPEALLFSGCECSCYIGQIFCTCVEDNQSDRNNSVIFSAVSGIDYLDDRISSLKN